MTNPESETLKAGINNVVASGGTGIVIFAIFVAAQIIVGGIGLVLDHLTTLDHRFDRAKTPAVIQPTNR